MCTHGTEQTKGNVLWAGVLTNSILNQGDAEAQLWDGNLSSVQPTVSMKEKNENDVLIIVKKYKNTELAIRIGGHKLNDNTFTGHEKFYDISTIVIHPNFKPKINEEPCIIQECPHDLVMYILEENIDLNFYTPVCLPLSSEVRKFDGRLMTLAGWGNTISPESKAPGIEL